MTDLTAEVPGTAAGPVVTQGLRNAKALARVVKALASFPQDEVDHIVKLSQPV